MAVASSSDRPNVLLIFTDQQRFDTVAALGNGVIRTPNLDRLVRSGVAFTHAYSPSPVCVSARCSMMYGQYPARSGCPENHFPMPTDGRPSFVQALTDAGYRTHSVGKRHFMPDPGAHRGFETMLRQEELVGADTPEEACERDEYLKFLHEAGFGHVCDPHGVRGEMYYTPQVAQMPAEFHPTQWVGDRTVEFVNEQAGSGRPWMCFSSYIHPHPPAAPPNPWHKLYRGPRMPLPKLPPDRESLMIHINRHQNRYKYRDQGFDLNLNRQFKAHYYATISFVDYQVGRILDALEATDQRENTLILFTSDHGEFCGDYQCFGKRAMHDSASRVPMIASLPGRLEGGQPCSRPASLVDIAATVAAATGAEMPSDQLDGVDLADLAAGASQREYVFSQHDQADVATYMAVSERWKYFYSAADDKEVFFDRAADPLELRNKAGCYQLGDDQAEVKQRLIDHLRSLGEPHALDGDDFRTYRRRTIPENPDAGLLIQDHRWADTAIPGYTEK